jgi:hypothetical protein
MRIIELIQKNRHIKLAGNEKLRIERELPDPKDRAQMVRDVLRAQRHGETAAEEKRLSGRSQYRSLAQVSALRGLSAGPNPGFGPPRRLGSAERAFEGHFQHQNSRFPAWNGHKALLNREYFGGPAGKFQGGNC